MATVRREFTIDRPAGDVWALLSRFEAPHEVAPGFVTATEIEPSGARMATFANGLRVREWLVSADETARRFVYAITDSPAFSHYNAAFQVSEEGSGSRIVWTVDFLPDAMAERQEAAMTACVRAMQARLG